MCEVGVRMGMEVVPSLNLVREGGKGGGEERRCLKSGSGRD